MAIEQIQPDTREPQAGTVVKPHFTIWDEFCVEKKPHPCGIVIFGASGDLTHRKLLPALAGLFARDLLPPGFFIVGCARTPMTDESFRDTAREALQGNLKNHAAAKIDEFLGRLFYISGNYDDPELYRNLKSRSLELDVTFATGRNLVFYLSTPPNLYGEIVDQLAHAGLTQEPEDRTPYARVIVEKPFGHDLASAMRLDKDLRRSLGECQIYRMDHYLGKETVQNILMFRFANAVFEPIWNRQYIDHIQITVAESIGIGHRAGYFEQAGIMRDIFQNHMMQMLALVAMEPPNSFEADHVRDEKVKLLRSIHPFPLDRLDEWVVRGQYAAGDLDGQHIPGYREEEGVAPDSMVDTYLAARLYIDNWRWQGVPFYLRSGKRLARRVSEIAITFKRVPHSMFYPIRPDDLVQNTLVLNVQPDEGISLTIQAKHPGPKLCMSALTMDFLYREAFGEDPPDAYERLLQDVMLGDQTLFVRQDAMETTWALLTPVLEEWARQGREGRVHPYAPGSWGPTESDALPRREGRQWREL